jgi:hypothetical protein
MPALTPSLAMGPGRSVHYGMPNHCGSASEMNGT